MSTTATVPSTIHIRPSRLAGLLVAVAIVTGVATWSVSQVTTESHAPSSSNSHLVSSPDPATKAYLEGLGVLDAEQRAAIYGNVYANQSQQRLDAEAKLRYQPRRLRQSRTGLPDRSRSRRRAVTVVSR